MVRSTPTCTSISRAFSASDTSRHDVRCRSRNLRFQNDLRWVTRNCMYVHCTVLRVRHHLGFKLPGTNPRPLDRPALCETESFSLRLIVCVQFVSFFRALFWPATQVAVTCDVVQNSSLPTSSEMVYRICIFFQI